MTVPIFSASVPASAGPEIVVCRTANSSPPKRATRSFSPHGISQAIGNLYQQCIARRVSERIVDILEFIQVEEQHRQLRLVAVARAQRGVEVVEKSAAVGKARQRILAGQGGNARVGRVELMRETHVDGQDQHGDGEEDECRRGDGDPQPVLIHLHAG